MGIRAAGKLAMCGLLLAGGALGAACDRGAAPAALPRPASQPVQVTGDMTRTPAAAVGVVKSLAGTGTQSSGNFSVMGAWKVVWSATGPIEVRVISGETFEAVKVLKSAADGEEVMAGSCACYLEVSSAGRYTVTVTDTPN